jgi:hypothetical protein
MSFYFVDQDLNVTDLCFWIDQELNVAGLYMLVHKGSGLLALCKLSFALVASWFLYQQPLDLKMKEIHLHTLQN